MRIFRNDSKLASQFARGQVPLPQELLGPKGEANEWKVEMLTGVLIVIYVLFGRWLNHRKRISPGANPDDPISGSNIFFKALLWGWFVFTRDLFPLKDDGDDKPVMVIDYRVRKNLLSRIICDHMRTVVDENKSKDRDGEIPPNELIGRFHFRIFGWLIFIGYFKLTRIVAAAK